MADKESTVAEQVFKNMQTEDEADLSVADHEFATPSALALGGATTAAQRGFFLTQRILVLGAICVVLLSVFDTYSNQPDALPAIEQQPFDAVQTFGVADGISLAASIDRFDERRIFGPPPVVDAQDTPEVSPIRGWRAEVREYWDLKGSSQVSGVADEFVLEAIVFDSRAQRLQFLRAGMVIQISEHEVDVTRVEPDRVELRRGDEVFVLD